MRARPLEAPVTAGDAGPACRRAKQKRKHGRTVSRVRFREYARTAPASTLSGSLVRRSALLSRSLTIIF